MFTNYQERENYYMHVRGMFLMKKNRTNPVASERLTKCLPEFFFGKYESQNLMLECILLVFRKPLDSCFILLVLANTTTHLEFSFIK